MAIAFVSFTGDTANATVTGTITLPATAANDILILIVACRDNLASATLTGTYAGGAWTEFLADDGANLPGVALWWSRCTGNHSTQTIICANASAGSMSMGVARISGCITGSTPIDTDTNKRRDNASPDVNTLTGFNTTVANTFVVLATGGQDDVAVMSSPLMDGFAMAVLGTDTSSGGSDSNIGLAGLAQAAAGATGNFNFTQDLGPTDAKWILAFALKPPQALILSAATGAYSLSGVNPTLRRTHILVAALGSYVLTGVTATLSKGFRLTADVGAYVLSGVTTTLLWNRVLSAATGVYTLTGVTATLARGYVLSAAVGAYVLTGGAANLLWNHVLAAATGVYTLTGITTGLAKGYLLSAATGVYTLTGNVVDLIFGGVGAAVLDRITTIGGTAFKRLHRHLKDFQSG